MLSPLPGLSHLIFIATLGSIFLCYPFFTGEKAETQQGENNLLTHILQYKILDFSHMELHVEKNMD